MNYNTLPSPCYILSEEALLANLQLLDLVQKEAGVRIICALKGYAFWPSFPLILKGCNDGTYNYIEDVKEYGEKAAIMKKMFLDNGFEIVYDKDGDKPLADGFYFTVAYPGMTSDELLHEFLYYGVSAISLSTCGSERNEGLRACVSLTPRRQFPILEERLKLFKENH